MKNKYIISVVFLFVLVMSGCATPTKMAFHDDSGRLTEKSNPVFLMTATIRNTYKTSFQPRLLFVSVEKPDAKQASDRLNFKMDDIGKDETNSAKTGNNYLIRMELPAGKYEIQGMTSLARSFPINGFFFTPMHMEIEAKEPGVFYLGHVTATVRERQGNEFKAGPSIPLIDQAIAGASGGTFDVVISDDYVTDTALFRTKFPALTGIEIKKDILPAFDRDKAQRWWEAH